jgi:error-prone DNA polymerase
MYINCHSCFSFKYGVMPVKDLLAEAARNGVRRMALTDINNTAGLLDFIRLAPEYGVEPVAGVDVRNGARQLYVALAANNEGLRELNAYLSLYMGSEDKLIPVEAPAFSNVFVIYPFDGNIPANLRENEYIGVAPRQQALLLSSPYRKFIHRLVLLHPVTFRDKQDFNTHRLLRAIACNELLSKVPAEEFAQPTETMQPLNDLRELYKLWPALWDNTHKLLTQCHVAFDFREPKNKRSFTGSKKLDLELLKRECQKGMEYRYGTITDEIVQRTNKELEMIDKLGFAAYFLINWDIVRFARHRNFFYVGRGSGANSMVAYLLRITDVDPLELDLYFERFINEFRSSPPDFDLDFSWKERDEVIRYIFKRYGTQHVAQLATYSTFQSSSVIRELGKVFGLPKPEIDALVLNRKNPETPDHIARLIHLYGKQIQDLPSHFSIHAGGMLISELPIHHYTATHVPPKGFPVTQFSMLEAEDIGLYKFDILSQRGLGHIRDTVDIVKKNRGIDIDIHRVADFKKDERIREHLREGRCMGCFYVESPAMRMLLQKLRADDYLTLVAASSIIRPGVARSGMMREYIQRYRNPETTKYIHPVMKELMEETFGVMVYQEDVIKVAHHFAGLSLSESDVLRRGMSGKFRSREEFQKIRDKFFESCRAKGYEEAITAEVWRQIESFAGYSFSKGHSASYAVESYQSLYLKAYYPKEFMVGVINNFGGFYRTEYYLHEARMCGAIIHAPCVNNSEYLTGIKGDDLYLGFVHLAGLELQVSQQIEAERKRNGAYKSLSDFMDRVPVTVEQLRILIRIGAFRFTGADKKELLWQIHTLQRSVPEDFVTMRLFDEPRKDYALPELQHNRFDDAFDEIELLGFALCSPFDLVKREYPRMVKADNLKSYAGRTVEITGYLVTVKPTRTIKGEEMMFGTFIDPEGRFFDTTHFPQIAKQFPLRGKGCYVIKGKVTMDFDFPSVDVVSMERLEMVQRTDVVAGGMVAEPMRMLSAS